MKTHIIANLKQGFLPESFTRLPFFSAHGGEHDFFPGGRDQSDASSAASEAGDEFEPNTTVPEDLARAIAAAKSALTRRVNTFRALIGRKFSQQELTNAHTNTLAACTALEAELKIYLDHGFSPESNRYLDGMRRITFVQQNLQNQYDALILDFLNNSEIHRIADARAHNQTIPADSIVDVTGSLISNNITPTEAAEVRNQLALQEEVGLRALQREERKRQRELRAEAEAREIARREEELQDQFQARQDALRLEQQQVRVEVDRALSSRGSLGRLFASRGSRTRSVRSGRSSRRSVLDAHGLGRQARSQIGSNGSGVDGSEHGKFSSPQWYQGVICPLGSLWVKEPGSQK